ncbi:AAA family ATPase [Baekduia sp. Peel2402]|uniref:AAA family ATPase n=1 Tax=Baekduia sp. Peel2402 TaxID=3458296 RepID=UPI00403E36CC
MTPGNPYSNVGAVVQDEEFVGRARELARLQTRLGEGDPASTSIVGLPRIGKTSLAHHALRGGIELDRRTLVVWLNTRTAAKDLGGFFAAIARQIVERLEEAGVADDALREKVRAVGQEPSDADRFARLQHLLGTLRRSGTWVILALDEFDGIRKLFGDSPDYGFATLRELGHEPDSRLALVTISRRPLVEIATRSTIDESTFPNIFQEARLRPFSEDEFEELVARADRAGLPVEDAVVRTIARESGRHPYLASLMLAEAVDELGAPGDAVVERVAGTSIDYLRDVLRRFEDDGQLPAAIEALVGSVERDDPPDPGELERYGVVRRSASGRFEAFTPLLVPLLENIARGGDYWPLWRDTEQALRALIVECLEREHGAPLDWSDVAASRPALAGLIDRLADRQERERRTFGRCHPDLLQFAYPLELLDVIAEHWVSSFAPIFGSDVPYWRHRFRVLAKVRVPVAHSREGVLSSQDRDEARGACKGILEAIGRYRRASAAVAGG